MKIISGSSNLSLAQNIAQKLNYEMVDVEISHFANGEKRVWIKGDVKGQNIALVQSFSNPTNKHIMEFLLIADALERMGARHVNLILPWMGYSLQDKVFREGEPIAAKVVANLVSSAYIDELSFWNYTTAVLPDSFHSTQHLGAIDLFVSYIKDNLDLANCVAASPDFGGLKRARVFAQKLDLDLVNIDKHRDLHTGQAEALGVSGNVQGKEVLIFDDVINSGSTVVTASQILKQQGAKAVHFLAAHGIFAHNGVETINNSAVDTVVVTNSIAHQDLSNKIKVIDCSTLFAEALSAW